MQVLNSATMTAANYMPKDFTGDAVHFLEGEAALAGIIECRTTGK